MAFSGQPVRSDEVCWSYTTAVVHQPRETANYLSTKAAQIKINLNPPPPVAPSNLGLILFVLALERGATVVLQISLKALKAKETQAWLSAWCWMRFKPTQSDGSVPHPTPNPLISLLGDRRSGKILCVYYEKYNPFFHMDYRQWYKSCRQSDFKCWREDGAEVEH